MGVVVRDERGNLIDDVTQKRPVATILAFWVIFKGSVTFRGITATVYLKPSD